MEDQDFISVIRLNFDPDKTVGSSVGRADLYQFESFTLIIENDDKVHPLLAGGSYIWSVMEARYGQPNREPSMGDYVIETQGGIHQRFHVTPLRQDFYEWNKAMIAIAEHMQENGSWPDVWLAEGSGNFSSVNITEELQRILKEGEAEATG